MGIYVYESRALEHLPDGPCSFPELVQLMLDAGEDICAYRSDDVWYDLGTIAEYERAVAELDRLGGARREVRLEFVNIAGSGGAAGCS